MGQALKQKRTLWVVMLAAMGVGIYLTLWGCGGKGYDDPVQEAANAYYANETTVSTLVDPATVHKWVVDNGNKTDDGKRVVVLDVFPNDTDIDSWFAGDATLIKQQMITQYGGATSPQYISIDTYKNNNWLGHIPGALPQVSHAGYEVATRNDGPIEAEHEVGTGAYIDQMLQKLGVRKDDVLVLTTSRYDYPGFCSSRLWWTLYYWGFSRNNIKVLNGGNLAYAKAGYPLETGKVIPQVTTSTFSITQLALKHFDARISIGELIGLVDSGRTSLPDSDPNKVVVLDTRQPPVAYYFLDLVDASGNPTPDGIPDIFQVTNTTVGGSLAYNYLYKLYNYNATVTNLPPTTNNITLSQVLFNKAYNDGTNPRVAFSGTALPPITLPNNYVGIHTATGPARNGSPLALPLGNKAAAFEGIIKGAKVTKNGSVNITVPMLMQADGISYKSKSDMQAVFATAGIDGTKPIVVYCNSGALASIYFYALHEVCGFQNVKLYDGSWLEWANLAGYEPTDPAYVMNDDYTTYPAYPAGSPSVVFFAGPNKYLEWDGSQFVDSYTRTAVGSLVKKGGTLGGNTTWDTVHRSEHVMFRPLGSLSYPKNLMGTKPDGTPIYYQNKTYNSLTDWAPITTHPAYSGPGNEIYLQDKAYTKPAGTSSGGSTPDPFVPTGGGC